MSLEALSDADDEFHAVLKAAGVPYSPDACMPVVVERVTPPRRLAEAYAERVRRVCEARGLTPDAAQRAPLYHGTTEAALPCILSGGYDPAKNRVAAWGLGTYFATTPSISLAYTRTDEHGYAFMLVNRVVVGKSCVGTASTAIDRKAYDSARNTEGNIVVAPTADGALPLYVMRCHGGLPVAPVVGWNPLAGAAAPRRYFDPDQDDGGDYDRGWRAASRGSGTSAWLRSLMTGRA